MPSDFAIGTNDFLNLAGTPLPVTGAIEVRTYPGFDYGTAWHMGTPPSEPFPMFSRQAVADVAAGMTKIQEYAVQVGQVLTLKYQDQELWAGIAAAGGLPAHPPTKVLVQAVRPLRSYGIRVPVGFSGNYIVDAQWLLVAWPVEEEE
jgi:hypothetical protein